MTVNYDVTNEDTRPAYHDDTRGQQQQQQHKRNKHKLKNQIKSI